MKSIFSIFFSVSVLICFGQGQNESINTAVEKYDQNLFNELNDSGLQLFVFYSTTCPICKNYTKTLNEISDQYSERVEIYLVFSGKHHSERKIRDYLKAYSINDKVILDKKYQIADRLNATITPEVVLYSNHKILYQGAFDDWVIRLGMTRDKATKHYLTTAIEAALSGKTIEVASHEAIGCFIR